MTKILPALRALLFALATLASGLMTGCGLKGDLVLPDTAPEAATSSGESASGQDEADEAEDAGKHQQASTRQASKNPCNARPNRS